jgi:hypothetical protein
MFYIEQEGKMKRYFIAFILCYVIITFSIPQRVIAQDSTFAFILNGHKYNQAEDLMMRGIHEWFDVALDSLDIPTLLDTLGADIGLTIDSLTLPGYIDVHYDTDESETYDILTKIIMDTLYILANGFDCDFDVKIGGAGFTLKAISTYENGQLKLEFGSADTLKPEISVIGTGHILCPALAEMFKEEMDTQVDSLLLSMAMMLESEGTDGLFTLLNPIQSLGIEDSVIIEQALSSFPMEMDLYGKEDPAQGIVQLIIEINFLTGTTDNHSAFIGIEPSPIDGSQLKAGGFSFLYWVLQMGFPWHVTWNESERVDYALSIMEESDFQDFRLELRWSDLQKRAYRGDQLDPANISSEDIEDFLAHADHWDTTAFETINTYISNGSNRDLQTFMAIGVGHQDRMPLDENGKRIAPATEGWEPADEFTGVSANEYLYNLKIYAHATVRKFADDIHVWQIENELNAAFFAAAIPEWWRKGDLWLDREFRNKVWQILVEAVRSEDPDALIIHDFHMLGFMAALEDWSDDLNIIGINYYPNQLASLPVMGFSVGEYVWAVRRALKGLGYEDIPVWVTETGYPGIEIEDPADNISLADDVDYFSESRQSAYLGTALTSAVEKGAEGFFYYSLVTQEDFQGSTPTPMRFSGLIRRESDEHKPALDTFSNLFTKFITAPTSLDENSELVPQSASLFQNYPNPFNPVTLIKYQLSMSSEVNLSIYNLLGEKVAILVSEYQGAGLYSVKWDASDFASGVYFYRLQAGNFSDFRKMVLIK